MRRVKAGHAEEGACRCHRGACRQQPDELRPGDAEPSRGRLPLYRRRAGQARARSHAHARRRSPGSAPAGRRPLRRCAGARPRDGAGRSARARTRSRRAARRRAPPRRRRACRPTGCGPRPSERRAAGRAPRAPRRSPRSSRGRAPRRSSARPRAAASGRTLRSTPMTARKSSYRSLTSLERDLARCRACLEAGYPLESLPVRAPGTQQQRAYMFGQAPGVVEGEERLPWRGRAGRTLRRWLELDEEGFYATFFCASVTRCYPGRAPSGRGDRTPTPREQELCAFWQRWELELLRPGLIVTVGGLALRRLLGLPQLTAFVGERYEHDRVPVVPLPHPSGASGWLNDAANRERLARALELVRTELAALA